MARRSFVASLFFATLAGVASAQVAAPAANAPQLLPYTSKLVAGVVTPVTGTSAGSTPGNTSAVTAGAVVPCPSGLTATDKYGDGCLANEIALTAPRFAVADKNNNVFISDWTNGLIRRVDATTNVITSVVTGLKNPAGLAFDAAGNLYFADNGTDVVRKVAATNGLITAGAAITLVAGNGSGTYGYAVNNTAASGAVISATQGYLNYPFGIAFDAAGNLYIADEGNNAVEVVNLGTTTQIIQGLTVPAGTIAKIVGYGSLSGKTVTADCPSFTSTSARGGCYFALFTDGAKGVVSPIHYPYGVAVDPTGNVYFSNEYYDDVARLTPTNTLNNYSGILNTALKPPTTTRGTAGSFATGSPFGTATDGTGNLYFTDASNGLIWRVDAGSKAQYIVAGGATTAAAGTCSGSTDTYGDGCLATQAYFGSTGTLFASGSSPGIFGVSVDSYSDLFVGDTVTNLVREITTNAYFGVVGANQPTQTVLVHYVAGDGPASNNAYTITSGMNNFNVGTPGTCITNSDSTKDCPVPVQATPSVLGPFTGTLTVTSSLGATSSFTLGGIYAQSPKTRLAVTFSDATTTCSGTSTYPNTDSILLTGTLVANGPNPPNGTITFYANGAQVGTPQSVTNIGTSANPVYGATLSYVFITPNNYTITAVYSGDTTAPIYFSGSNGAAAATLTSATPSFTATATAYQQSNVVAGQTGLYSFTLSQLVYTGTINLACSGLPANSSCSFSPSTITATGCSTSNTIALSILTQGGVAGQTALGLPGSGPLQLLTMIFGVGLALLIGLRRRRLPMGGVWMALAVLLASSGLMACNSVVKPLPVTPSGSYNVTVTATGSASNIISSFTVPLVVK